MATPIAGGSDTTPPTPPSNATATAVGSGRIDVAWTASTDNVGVTESRVERCQGSGCSGFAQVATVTATSYSNTGLSAGTSYSYRVRAADAAGNLSGYSNIANATVPAPDTTPPAPPSNATATAVGSGRIDVAWTASTDNVGVERCQGSGCSGFGQVATVTGTSYDDTGLLSGTSYSYRVRAADNAGNLSGYSNVVTAITESQASGLVAAYAFDEGAGSVVADASGNGHTGTISGATWIAAGRYNRGLDFNGTNALVTIGDAAKLDLTTGMTLAAWVYPTPTLTNWSTVVMKEQPGHFVYTLYAGSPANRPSLYFNISTGSSGERSVTGPTALPLNTWIHLAGAYDGATLRLYVNGTPVASQAATGAIATSVSPLRIGGNAVWGEYFRGRIDEVRVYNRAFSQADIQQAMNTPLSATPPDPVPPK